MFVKLEKLTIILVFAAIISYALPAKAADNSDPEALFDKVLGKYVSDEGLVDYKGLKGDKEFLEYVKYISNTEPDSLPSDKHRLAFWINAYNTFVLFGVLEEYPIKGVLEVGLVPHSFFRLKKFRTKHGKITLTTLENKKIREAFREPLIHFAVNCASGGCPKLANKAYRAETLDRQLKDGAASFINNREKNYLDREKRVLRLSKIFEWYRDDFVGKDEKLENYVAQYLNAEDSEFIKNNEVVIEFLEYDWNLNEKK